MTGKKNRPALVNKVETDIYPIIKKLTKKLYIISGCMFILAGCIYNEEPMPQIKYSPTTEPVVVPQQTIPAPKPPTPVPPASTVPAWLPPSGVEKGWTAIIIHHSATENGNMAIFDDWHKKYNHWEGVGYDFVIGNGTDSGDGQVEVTFRWKEQIPGAHTGGTPNNWANVDGIGICLVGDFNVTTPTAQQIQSLARLVRFLQQRYGIPNSRVYGHGTTPGGHATDCPGKKFPMSSFKSMLGR
jgi:hypothetical protein